MEAFSVRLFPLFEWLIKTTIQGSVLIGLIMLVKVILRGRLPIRWHYFFWLLLLVRLAAPRLPQSRFSIFNFVPESSQLGRFEILPLLWLVGALIMVGIVGARNFSLWRTVRRERPITDQEVLDLLEDCKMEMGVKTIVGVVVSDRVKSPVLFGFVRPRLLLPQGILEAYGLEELRYIFIHELAHFKQRDIYLGWLVVLLQILHWFNPLMWFAFHRMRVDRELACDGLAVSRMDTHEPPQYGRTILNLFERFSQVSYVPSIAGILEDSSKLERRIKMIAKFKKTSRKRSVAAVLVMMALAFITLTDAYSAPPFNFGTPTNLGPTVNTAYADACPSISSDGLTLYFSDAPWNPIPAGHGNGDIWIATRQTKDDPWGTPINLGPLINSSSNESTPSISTDNLTLYFTSSRNVGNDIWVTTRATTQDEWSTPVNAGSPFNTMSFDGWPNISHDDLSLYFYSQRQGGIGSGDIWVTTRSAIDSPWGPAVNLGPTINSSADDGAACISANNLFLFFTSNRSGNYDLYVSWRATTDDPWCVPVNLESINSSATESGPYISTDGSVLFFHSDRADGFGDTDLYQVAIEVVQALPDFNKDGKVDFRDFTYLAFSWSEYQSAMDIFPPLFGDGEIDFRDVDFFAENWLLSIMQARNPNPADGTTGVYIDTDLSWTPIDEAAFHEIYFGIDHYTLPFVASQPVGQESYDPPGDLIPGTTYYWRIDEVNDAGPPPGKWPGVLWSFTTIRGQAHTPSPADGAVIGGSEYEYPPDSGNWYIYTKLMFTEGPTADPDPNVRRAYFSNNRDDVVSRVQDANLGPPPYAGTPGYETTYYAGNPVIPPVTDTLVRGMSYYWCVDETDVDGHTYPGDIWEFTIQSYYAFAPNPPNEAVLVDPNVLLSWSEGYGAQQHDIYLGTSWEDVNNAAFDAFNPPPEFVDTRSVPNCQASGLPFDTKLYWRVDEVIGRGPPLFIPEEFYKGDVWCFTTGAPPPP